MFKELYPIFGDNNGCTDAGVVGFESHSSHGYLLAFILFGWPVCRYRPRDGLIPIPRTQTLKRIKKLIKRSGRN
jgi:hypothetical protein